MTWFQDGSICVQNICINSDKWSWRWLLPLNLKRRRYQGMSTKLHGQFIDKSIIQAAWKYRIRICNWNLIYYKTIEPQWEWTQRRSCRTEPGYFKTKQARCWRLDEPFEHGTKLAKSGKSIRKCSVCWVILHLRSNNIWSSIRRWSGWWERFKGYSPI